jgi:isocitrate dehydrogenase kinase/phosphatase
VSQFRPAVDRDIVEYQVVDKHERVGRVGDPIELAVAQGKAAHVAVARPAQVERLAADVGGTTNWCC